MEHPDYYLQKMSEALINGDPQLYRHYQALYNGYTYVESKFTEAAIEGDVGTISRLLRTEDPSANNNEAIRMAAKNGHIEIVYLLLQDPRVDPSANNNEAIAWAITEGFTEIFILLWRDPRIRLNSRMIQHAAEEGSVEILRLLLADPELDPSINNNGAIRGAATTAHPESVQLLLADPRVDPTANYNEAIREAARLGRIETVQLLLQDPRVDPGAGDNEAIRLAARRDHHEIVRLLLADPRVNPSIDNNYIFEWTIADRHLDIMTQLLLDPRVGPSVYNTRALDLAVKYDNSEAAFALSKHPGLLLPTIDEFMGYREWHDLTKLAQLTGALSDSREDLLVWAAAVGSLNLVRTLVENGVDPTFADNSAISAAQKNRHLNIVKYLQSLPAPSGLLNYVQRLF